MVSQVELKGRLIMETMLQGAAGLKSMIDDDEDDDDEEAELVRKYQAKVVNASTSSSSSSDTEKVLEVEDSAAVTGARAIRLSAVEAVAGVLKGGMRHFANHPFMHLQMARFFWIHRSNAHKMASALKNAHALKPLTDLGASNVFRMEVLFAVPTLTLYCLIMDELRQI